VGLPDWIEQLVAESTGKNGTGILPVVLLPLSPEVDQTPADLQLVRLVDDAVHFRLIEQHPDEILVSGSLGAQFVVWEYATAIAGRCWASTRSTSPTSSPPPLARCSTRAPTSATPPSRRTASRCACPIPLWPRPAHSPGCSTPCGLVSARRLRRVQAYADRTSVPQLAGIRELIAADTGRPTTFGWGPRFLHSTGQYHKGGPASGVFLQIIGAGEVDLEIPGRPFTFRQLITAQAAGDADVLVAHGRPVVTLTLTDPQVEVLSVRGRAVARPGGVFPMTAEISRDHNPLRDPDDRRLNRIAGPSALVIFGVTGDLSRKKLMPAVYDLANRGLLPPGFASWASRDATGRTRTSPSSTMPSVSTPARRSARRRGSSCCRASASCPASSATTTRSAACARRWRSSTSNAARWETTRSTCRSRRATSRSSPSS
jgi:hypothetical protein